MKPVKKALDAAKQKLTIPPKSVYWLIMANSQTPNVETKVCVSQVSERDLFEKVNAIATAFRVIEYRGTALFSITKDGNSFWSSTVTFTDDMPNGIWSSGYNN
jgi:hypothetical protein